MHEDWIISQLLSHFILVNFPLHPEQQSQNFTNQQQKTKQRVLPGRERKQIHQQPEQTYPVRVEGPL